MEQKRAPTDFTKGVHLYYKPKVLTEDEARIAADKLERSFLGKKEGE